MLSAGLWKISAHVLNMLPLAGERHTLERRVILEGHGGDGGRGCDEWSSEYAARRCRLHVIAMCRATIEGYAMYETVVYSEVVAVGVYLSVPGRRRPVPGSNDVSGAAASLTAQPST